MERANRQDIWDAVLVLRDTIPYFPQGPIAHDTIVDAVADFMGTREQLAWWVKDCVAHISKWEGVPLLRARYATRYAPSDGLPANVAPGCSDEEMEAQFRLREMSENGKRMAEYKRQAQLAPPEDRALFPLPDVKRLN